MGHTLDEWTTRVGELLRDEAGTDVDNEAAISALRTALVQYGVDEPARTVAESAGTGSPYLAMPDGWVSGASVLEQVEFPARANPPEFLDAQSWRLVRDPADVDVEQVLLADTPAASQWVRFHFRGPWPFPTDDSAVDLVGGVGFEAVANLAASHACTSLAARAARARAGALPTDFADGRDRARLLLEAAARLRVVYDSLLGLSGGDGSGGDNGGSSSSPAFGSYDYDPAGDSLFHGGRR